MGISMPCWISSSLRYFQDDFAFLAIEIIEVGVGWRLKDLKDFIADFRSSQAAGRGNSFDYTSDKRVSTQSGVDGYWITYIERGSLQFCDEHYI